MSVCEQTECGELGTWCDCQLHTCGCTHQVMCIHQWWCARNVMLFCFKANPTTARESWDPFSPLYMVFENTSNVCHGRQMDSMYVDTSLEIAWSYSIRPQPNANLMQHHACVSGHCIQHSHCLWLIHIHVYYHQCWKVGMESMCK